MAISEEDRKAASEEDRKAAEEDRKAAEEWARKRYWDVKCAGEALIEMDVECAIEDFLAGIEHERKRYYSLVSIDKKAIEACLMDRDKFIEQVGEKHWRIKDSDAVVGFPKTIATIQGEEFQVLSEPEYLHKLGNG